MGDIFFQTVRRRFILKFWLILCLHLFGGFSIFKKPVRSNAALELFRSLDLDFVAQVLHIIIDPNPSPRFNKLTLKRPLKWAGKRPITRKANHYSNIKNYFFYWNSILAIENFFFEKSLLCAKTISQNLSTFDHDWNSHRRCGAQIDQN